MRQIASKRHLSAIEQLSNASTFARPQYIHKKNALNNLRDITTTKTQKDKENRNRKSRFEQESGSLQNLGSKKG